MSDADAVLADLLKRARGGDREALGELLDAHRGQLREIARRSLGERLASRLDASDLVQQTCLSVYKKIGEFDGGDAAQFAAWLLRIHEHNVQNVIRDHLKARKRSADREVSAENEDAFIARQTSPSEQAIRSEEAARLDKAFEMLPDDEANVLRLRYIQGQTLQEISQAMGRTKDAVAWLMNRAIKKVKAHLQDQ